MILILCILLGIAMGQHIKIALTPELMAFITSSWALAAEKVPPVATLAAEKVKNAAKSTRLSVAKTVAPIAPPAIVKVI
jgi:hypothetical protein